MNIRGKPSILQKLVFELRYKYGFTYLDQCGRTVNKIMSEQPEWILRSDMPNPQNAPLVSIRNTCSFNFSALKLSFNLEMPLGGEPLDDKDVAEFTGQVDSVSAIVIEHLGLKHFTRIGIRVWYLFPAESKEDAEEWLQGLKSYSISDDLLSAFAGKTEATGVTVFMSGEDRKFRVAFNGVERLGSVDLGEGILNIKASSLSKDQDRFLKEQIRTKRRMLHNPEYAAMIDVDAFLDDPASVEPQDFIERSMKQISENLVTALK